MSRRISKLKTLWRRERDSNPEPLSRLMVFKTAGFNRSPIPPFSLINKIQRAFYPIHLHYEDFRRDSKRFSFMAITCSVLNCSNLPTTPRLCTGAGLTRPRFETAMYLIHQKTCW